MIHQCGPDPSLIRFLNLARMVEGRSSLDLYIDVLTFSSFMVPEGAYLITGNTVNRKESNVSCTSTLRVVFQAKLSQFSIFGNVQALSWQCDIETRLTFTNTRGISCRFKKLIYANIV